MNIIYRLYYILYIIATAYYLKVLFIICYYTAAVYYRSVLNIPPALRILSISGFTDKDDIFLLTRYDAGLLYLMCSVLHNIINIIQLIN